MALGHFPARPSAAERAAAASLVGLGAAVVLYGGWRYVRVAAELRGDASRGAHPSTVPVVVLTVVVTAIIGSLFFTL